ncbi:ribonuclease HI family protein [Amphibacillus indicireducens]|uniref:Reverse transcriptase-like protein n=1 Tax=Amphibacillus indicireducens TaxID=1076330 RepID=A0ABP7VQ18_9BACI
MLEIYIDGATKGYPGPSGISFIIKQGKSRVEAYKYIGQSSNHEAEFQALLYLLDYCAKHYPDQILSIRSDSKLVVDLIDRGSYKKEPFSSLVNKAMDKMNTFTHCFIKWVPESHNKQADKLAKLAIQTKNELIKKYPSV